MMPRLQAEETMAAATTAALGSGAMGRSERARILRALERQAGAGRPAARADRRVLSMIGIAVEEVPATAAGRDEREGL